MELGKETGSLVYQPKTGEKCTCRPGKWRNNCPACEGTGWRIDFSAIRAKARYFTKRDITQLSSPAQSPRYEMTIPAGTECERIGLQRRRSDYVVKDTSKVRGSNPHDLRRYWVWIEAHEIETR